METVTLGKETYQEMVAWLIPFTHHLEAWTGHPEIQKATPEDFIRETDDRIARVEKLLKRAEYEARQ